MERTLFPRRKTYDDTPDDLPEGMTHAADAPCPFAPDSLPRGPRCCSFDGDALRNALRAFGEDDCAEILSLGFELSVNRTRMFGLLLRELVPPIEYQYEGQPRWNRGRRVAWVNLRTGRRAPWPSDTVEKLATMRMAADWFEKVACLDFGACTRD